MRTCVNETVVFGLYFVFVLRGIDHSGQYRNEVGPCVDVPEKLWFSTFLFPWFCTIFPHWEGSVEQRLAHGECRLFSKHDPRNGDVAPRPMVVMIFSGSANHNTIHQPSSILF